MVVRVGEQNEDILLRTVTEDILSAALDYVDDFVKESFGDLPKVREWNCQRVDYAVNWKVGKELPVYMTILQGCRVGNWSRHPYDASEGVVWKSNSTRGRWIKFYNKTKELLGGQYGLRDDDDAEQARKLREEFKQYGALRYEVSNYRDATKYMASAWFDCERTVGEMTEFGRAAYVLSRMWDQLGLGKTDTYAHECYLLFRLAEAFGTRSVASAHYVLSLFRTYGVEAVELELVKRSSYYYQLRKLREHGFLVNGIESDAVDSEYKYKDKVLPALELPIERCEQALVNLKRLSGRGSNGSPGTTARKISWKNVCEAFGLADSAPRNAYMLERVRCLMNDD